MRAGIDVVDTTFRLAGGGALYDDHPLQRCWRDLHAGGCHIFFSDNRTARSGQAILGQPTEDWLTWARRAHRSLSPASPRRAAVTVAYQRAEPMA